MKYAVALSVMIALAACQSGTASPSAQSNQGVVSAMYEAFAAGDIEAVAAAMAPGIEWQPAENSPYAAEKPYVGPEAVVSGIFERLPVDWTYWKLDVDEIFESGDRVVALGRYSARHAGTGAEVDAQFAHVWRLENGRVVSFRQYTDTLQIAQAMAGKRGSKSVGKTAGRSGESEARAAKRPADDEGGKAAASAKTGKAGGRKKPARKPATRG